MKTLKEFLSTKEGDKLLFRSSFTCGEIVRTCTVSQSKALAFDMPWKDDTNLSSWITPSNFLQKQRFFKDGWIIFTADVDCIDVILDCIDLNLPLPPHLKVLFLAYKKVA